MIMSEDLRIQHTTKWVLLILWSIRLTILYGCHHHRPHLVPVGQLFINTYINIETINLSISKVVTKLNRVTNLIKRPSRHMAHNDMSISKIESNLKSVTSKMRLWHEINCRILFFFPSIQAVIMNVTRSYSNCYGLHYETVIWDEFYNKTRWSWQDDGLTLPTHLNIHGTQSELHHTISNSWSWEIGNIIFFKHLQYFTFYANTHSVISFCVKWSYTNVQYLWIIYR